MYSDFMYLTARPDIFSDDMIFIHYIFNWKSSEKLNEEKSRQKSYNAKLHES